MATLCLKKNIHRRSMFVCVDREQELVPGRGTDNNGALFHHTEADCFDQRNLPCPPYNEDNETQLRYLHKVSRL